MFAPIRPSPTNPIRMPCASLLSFGVALWPRMVVRPASASARASSSARSPRPGRPGGRRRIGRSWDSIAAKSPSAWASISRPKVYGQPGIGRSAGWSDGQLEEPAGRRTALVELPVECRNRGP